MADRKITTSDQLKMLALRGKADSTARVAELAALVASGLEDAQHIGITVVLPAACWVDKVQTVTHAALLADSNYWYLVCGDAGSAMDCADAGVKADNVTVNGQITFRCDTVPETDLTINVLRLEVQAE